MHSLFYDFISILYRSHVYTRDNNIIIIYAVCERWRGRGLRLPPSFGAASARSALGIFKTDLRRRHPRCSRPRTAVGKHSSNWITRNTRGSIKKSKLVHGGSSRVYIISACIRGRWRAACACPRGLDVRDALAEVVVAVFVAKVNRVLFLFPSLGKKFKKSSAYFAPWVIRYCMWGN